MCYFFSHLDINQERIPKNEEVSYCAQTEMPEVKDTYRHIHRQTPRGRVFVFLQDFVT